MILSNALFLLLVIISELVAVPEKVGRERGDMERYDMLAYYNGSVPMKVIIGR